MKSTIAPLVLSTFVGCLFVWNAQRLAARQPTAITVTFDVGEDTGTPVVEDYASKMPFAFTGTLKRVVVVLETDKLTA